MFFCAPEGDTSKEEAGSLVSGTAFQARWLLEVGGHSARAHSVPPRPQSQLLAFKRDPLTAASPGDPEADGHLLATVPRRRLCAATIQVTSTLFLLSWALVRVR